MTETLINNIPFSMILISRWKILQSGPFEYGLNDDGNVAGDTETEFVATHFDHVFSFVQYWS